jgi:hypothetical protein
VLLGVCAWPALSAELPFLPLPVRFPLGCLLLTFSPGIAVAGRLTDDLDPSGQIIVALGVGSAATPVLIDVLGRVHLIPAFPYVAAALAGAGLAGCRDRSFNTRPPTLRADAAACAALVALAVGLGAIAFSHRMVESPAAGIVLYGEYDTADLGYYAAEASEASHTIPPTASYYSGHRLNAA